MAEFLVRKEDSPTRKPGSYKAGDIVDVYEDGRCTEAPSPDSPFYIIKVPGLSTSEARKYIEPEIDGYVVNEFTPKEHIGNPQELQPNLIRRRAFGLDIDNLPAAARNALQTGRQAEIMPQVFLQRMRNKKTGRAER